MTRALHELLAAWRQRAASYRHLHQTEGANAYHAAATEIGKCADELKDALEQDAAPVGAEPRFRRLLSALDEVEEAEGGATYGEPAGEAGTINDVEADSGGSDE